MAGQPPLNLAEALLLPVSSPNFVPCPQITLTVDPETLGICSICQHTQLALDPSPELDVSLAAILPCGHIACHACLARCLQASPHCPFCRARFQYALCRHPLQPRLLARTELRSLPVSLPMGGAVADECPACRVATNARVSDELLACLADGFRQLRAAYVGASDESVKVRIAQKLRVNEQHFRSVARQLSAENVAGLRSQW